MYITQSFVFTSISEVDADTEITNISDTWLTFLKSNREMDVRVHSMYISKMQFRNSGGKHICVIKFN